MAFSSAARAWTTVGGAKRNSAAGSMNRVISHGQATRSIFGCSRVIHRIEASDQAGGAKQVDYNKCIIQHTEQEEVVQRMQSLMLTSTRNHSSMSARAILVTVLVLGGSPAV